MSDLHLELVVMLRGQSGQGATSEVGTIIWIRGWHNPHHLDQMGAVLPGAQKCVQRPRAGQVCLDHQPFR